MVSRRIALSCLWSLVRPAWLRPIPSAPVAATRRVVRPTRQRCAKSISASGKKLDVAANRDGSSRNGDGSGFCWFRRGDNLAIIGDNRPRLYMAFAAGSHRRRRGTDIRIRLLPEMTFVLENADRSSSPSSRIRSSRQTATEAREALRQIAHIIYEDHVDCAATTRRA